MFPILRAHPLHSMYRGFWAAGTRRVQPSWPVMAEEDEQERVGLQCGVNTIHARQDTL